MSDPGKHRPASHPLIRRMVERHAVEAQFILDKLEQDHRLITEALDEIARIVAGLPDCELTVAQQAAASVIAAELHRRSKRGSQRERYYRESPSPQVRERYARITAAVRDDPSRPIREIAAEFGVSTQLVSRVAISNGVRRRYRMAPTAEEAA